MLYTPSLDEEVRILHYTSIPNEHFHSRERALMGKDTNKYDKHDVESSKWLNKLLIASSADELNF